MANVYSHIPPVSSQIQRLLRCGIERVARLCLIDWLHDTLLTFLHPIPAARHLFPVNLHNTDLMCASLRRANMGGEYCLFFPIKPQRIKEHSPPFHPSTSPTHSMLSSERGMQGDFKISGGAGCRIQISSRKNWCPDYLAYLIDL